MSHAKEHRHFMALALGLAIRGQGQCAPNPAVGAVLVQNKRIIGSGWHAGPGLPHAEIMALKHASPIDQSPISIYVTLEPCSHYGRTPPCVNAIIEAGITKVYYGYLDPNPVVSGRGIEILKAAQISCTHVDSHAIKAFYQAYANWHTQQTVRLISKIAIFQDGSYAGPKGQALPITGSACKQLTFAGRAKADAILTTATTVKADNPQLNIRRGTKSHLGRPVIIIDRHLKVPANSLVFQAPQVFILYDPLKIGPHAFAHAHSQHVQYIAMPFHQSETIDWYALKKLLARLNFHTIWFEGGGEALTGQLKQQACDQLSVYLNPKSPKNLDKLCLKISLHQDITRLQWHSICGDDHLYFFANRD